MSNKNPFEIRSEVLELAKDYMDQQYRTNVEFAKKAFEEGQRSFEEYQAAVTKIYSMDELMDKAKEMYSFVSDKGNK